MGGKRALAPSILKTLIAIFFFGLGIKPFKEAVDWFISGRFVTPFCGRFAGFCLIPLLYYFVLFAVF